MARLVTNEMVEVAYLWLAACKKARVKSGEVYWSDENPDGDYVITVFDREGGLWTVHKGGDEDA